MRDQANTSACKTRPWEGYVYFIQAVNGGPVKIGFSANPLTRLERLQTGHPYELVIRHLVRGPLALERRLHAKYADHRLHGEWFDPTAAMAHEGRVMFDGRLPDPLLTAQDLEGAAVNLMVSELGLDFVPETAFLNLVTQHVPKRVEVNTAEPESGEAWSSDLL